VNPLIKRLATLQVQALLMTGSAQAGAVQTIAEAISEIQRLRNEKERLEKRERGWMLAFNDLCDQVEENTRKLTGGGS
jgi:hypothetical protein